MKLDPKNEAIITTHKELPGAKKVTGAKVRKVRNSNSALSILLRQKGMALAKDEKTLERVKLRIKRCKDVIKGLEKVQQLEEFG